ncbi:MAG: hypothetical protein Kow0098_17330 [Ignavibacteriaceae bacterium]
MNKPDIIKKISSIAGIKEHSANQFFETFLRKLVRRLQPGEAARIEEVGFFHYRKSTLPELSTDYTEPVQDSLFDEIVFTPTEDSPVYEQVSFDIPEKTFSEEHPADSHFSLSINKPLLPFEEENISDFILPPSGVELQRLLESKADKIIAGITIVKSKLDSDILTEPVADNQEVEDLWESLITEFESLKNSSGEIEPEDKTIEIPASVPDENPKIVEEVSHETVSDDKIQKDDELFPSLDISIDDSVEHEESETSDTVQPEAPAINQKDESAEDIQSVISPGAPESDTKMKSPDNKFQIVNSLLHSEILSLSDKEKNPSDTVQDSKSSLKKDRLTVVKADSRGYVEVQRSIEISELKQVSGRNKLEISDNKEKERSKSFNNKSSLKRDSGKKSIAVPFTIALVFMVILLVILFQFVKTAEEQDVYKSGIDSQIFSPDVQVIERNDAVPVTYPYDKDDIRLDVNFDSFVSSNIKTSSETELDSKEIIYPVEKNKTTSEQVVADIYKYDDSYVVQLAAFRDQNIAGNMVMKIRENGYDAFVEKADIPGKGTWFRVRVKGFNSLDEAKKFKNQKLK